MSKPVIPWVVSHKRLDPCDRYNQQIAKGVKFDIKPGEKVLDVGPMCFPFPHATHYLGCDPRDNPQNGKPFELADIQKRTPYPDKFFDYVYCSHVLEHLDDPVAGARELSRIGKRGYIEVPSGWCTLYLFYGEVHPKWFFYTDPDGTLAYAKWDLRVLKAYSDVDAKGAMDRIVNGDPTVERLTGRELKLRAFYYNHAAILDPYQCWTDAIKMCVGGWFK